MNAFARLKDILFLAALWHEPEIARQSGITKFVQHFRKRLERRLRNALLYVDVGPALAFFDGR
jgi:hypothetical protein